MLIRGNNRSGRNRGAEPPMLERQALAAIRRNNGSLWMAPTSNAGLFTDSAGTTPAAAVGDVLGLVTDRSYGSGGLGPELLSTGVVQTLGGATVATYNTETGVGIAYRTDVSNQSGVRFEGRLGALHRVSITVTSGIVHLRNGGVGDSIFGTNLGVGTYTIYGEARRIGGEPAISAIAVSSATASAGFIVNSIREVLGNHATQPTTANKPIIAALPNGKRAMKFDGVNDFLQTGITAGNEGWMCAGINLETSATAYLMYAGGNTNAEAGVALRSISGRLQMICGNGSVRETQDSQTVAVGAQKVYEGGWNASSMFTAIDGVTAPSAKANNCTGSILMTLGAIPAGFPMQGPATAFIYTPVLPSAADRATIRRWVGRLQGQTL